MIARKLFDAPRLRIWLPRTLYPVPCPAAYRGAFFANAGQGGPLCAQVVARLSYQHSPSCVLPRASVPVLSDCPSPDGGGIGDRHRARNGWSGRLEPKDPGICAAGRPRSLIALPDQRAWIKPLRVNTDPPPVALDVNGTCRAARHE
jgi:hypothetical protein